MHRNYQEYVPRAPRYPTAATGGFPVQVERASDQSPSLVKALLLNFSRNGFQLRTAVPLTIGETVVLRLKVAESGFQTTVASEVRWQRSKGEQTWLQGCAAEQEVDWEVLGELFLHGILATEVPCP